MSARPGSPARIGILTAFLLAASLLGSSNAQAEDLDCLIEPMVDVTVSASIEG